MTLSESLRRHARDYLIAALAQSGGNVAEAARIAGVPRQNFYRLGARCGVNLKHVNEARQSPKKRHATTHIVQNWNLPRGLTWSP
jgi:hypothetical protein